MPDQILPLSRLCIKCGATERNAQGGCKACARACAASWAAANPERVKANAAKWREANADKKKESNAAWRAANVDQSKANSAAWYAANPARAKANGAAYRVENHDSAKVYGAAWRAANPTRIKKLNAAWRAANPERAKEASRAWQAANPEAKRIRTQNRRAKKRENGGTLSKGLAIKLFALQKGKCPCCNLPLGDNYHMDHIIPIALGGANIDGNIQLMRATCNQQKNAKHPIDFMQSRGFLI